MKRWLAGCDEAMRIRMDGGAVGVQIEQQCRSAMLLVSDTIGNRQIMIQYLPTDQMLADILTKGLPPGPKVKSLVDKLGIYQT